MEQDELKDDLDFSGKVLLVYLAGQRVQDSIAIEYAKLETRAERLFLVGRIPEMEGQEWLSNCTTAIAWDSIIQYIEFKTKNDYQERIRKGVKPTIRRKLGI